MQVSFRSDYSTSTVSSCSPVAIGSEQLADVECGETFAQDALREFVRAEAH